MVKGYKEGNKKIYRQSFCAYFDILGFSEKILEDDLIFFNKYLNVLEAELDYLDKRHDFYDKESFKRFELKIFTDNFVLGYPWQDEYGEAELGYLFEILSHIQYTFINAGIFVRGAISLSNLYMDNNIVIGKALIEAYKLENEKSIDPRIILSENVIAVVKKHMGYYGFDKENPQNKQYLIDKDGQYFLNYLYGIIEDCIERYGEFIPNIIEPQIINHKEKVVENLQKNKNTSKVFLKFSWVAIYHNYFCDNFLRKKKGVELENLKIDSVYFEQVIRRCV